MAKFYPVKDQSLLKLPSQPLSEYPRPGLKRDSYLCLNGQWDCEITKSEKIPETFSLKIIVPYAVESPLSGLNKPIQAADYIWYRTKVTLPAGFRKKHTFINFDGVDQEATVYIDGKEIISHLGCYTRFQAEIPPETHDEFELLVRVRDVTDGSYHTVGKQTNDSSHGWFYSPSSGIVKPVWIEAVPETYIKHIFFTPLFDEMKVKIRIEAEGSGEAELKIDNQMAKIPVNTETTVSLQTFFPWSPEHPYLYDVQVRFQEDQVSSYFGMRKIEACREGKRPGLYLNNRKIFLTGLLDQGYYFLGDLTPKSYADYENDIKNVKGLGFNCLRKHVKLEEDLYYYYADKYGLLLIQDFPNGGRPYVFWHVVKPRLFPFLNHDVFSFSYKYLSRQDKEGREEFYQEGDEYLKLLYNHPSIIVYTIFNEGWGEFDGRKAYIRFKSQDPSRLFDTASGWYDCPVSDVYSIHAYISTHHARYDRKKHRPYILTEIGGAALKVPEHFFFAKVYGHHICKTKADLTKRYQRLYRKDIIPLAAKGQLSAAIYTQLADCETECNGLYSFDRAVLKIDPEIIREINADLKEKGK